MNTCEKCYWWVKSMYSEYVGTCANEGCDHHGHVVHRRHEGGEPWEAEQ